MPYCDIFRKPMKVSYRFLITIDFIALLITAYWATDLPSIASDAPLPRPGFAPDLTFSYL